MSDNNGIEGRMWRMAEEGSSTSQPVPGCRNMAGKLNLYVYCGRLTRMTQASL